MPKRIPLPSLWREKHHFPRTNKPGPSLGGLHSPLSNPLRKGHRFVYGGTDPISAKRKDRMGSQRGGFNGCCTLLRAGSKKSLLKKVKGKNCQAPAIKSEEQTRWKRDEEALSVFFSRCQIKMSPKSTLFVFPMFEWSAEMDAPVSCPLLSPILPSRLGEGDKTLLLRWKKEGGRPVPKRQPRCWRCWVLLSVCALDGCDDVNHQDLFFPLSVKGPFWWQDANLTFAFCQDVVTSSHIIRPHFNCGLTKQKIQQRKFETSFFPCLLFSDFCRAPATFSKFQFSLFFLLTSSARLVYFPPALTLIDSDFVSPPPKSLFSPIDQVFFFSLGVAEREIALGTSDWWTLMRPKQRRKGLVGGFSVWTQTGEGREIFRATKEGKGRWQLMAEKKSRYKAAASLFFWLAPFFSLVKWMMASQHDRGGKGKETSLPQMCAQFC